jgi:predicted aspartyl protease
MPHFTVTIGSDGPVVDMAVVVGRARQRRLAIQGSPEPSPSTIRALIDTGSDLSVVHPQVLQQLGVQATGSVRIRRPGGGNGFRLATTFDIQLSIGGVHPATRWISRQVVGVAPSTPTILALIGRDVLEHCTLFYNGPRSELTLSY